MHDPKFEDVFAAFENLMQVFETHRSFIEKHEDFDVRQDFLNLILLSLDYIEEGIIRHSSWKSFFWAASIEITATVTFDQVAETMQKAGLPNEDIKQVTTVKKILEDIIYAKHDAYYCLRIIGAYFLPHIKSSMANFIEDDQSFILHSLDAFIGNNNVIEFYNNYINNTDSEGLKEEAKKYLTRVQEEIEN